MIFVTALTIAAALLRNDTLGNIAHTLYGAILVYVLTDTSNKDVLLLCQLATMTVATNLVFKVLWAAIFNYSTDYKDESKLIIRDTSILAGSSL